MSEVVKQPTISLDINDAIFLGTFFGCFIGVPLLFMALLGPNGFNIASVVAGGVIGLIAVRLELFFGLIKDNGVKPCQ